MASLATTSDGAYIYVALEDAAGLPVILRAARADLATWEIAYAPGAGSAANVAAVPSSADQMLFFGNFGTDVTVVSHVVSTAAETDISPASLGAKVVNTLQVDPSEALTIQVTVSTDQDFLATYDGGDNWTSLNAALGFDATAQLAFWAGDYDYDRSFLGGAISALSELRYTPNEGASLSDITGAGLGAAGTGVVGLEGKAP
jgi:hypothetical protein